MIVERKGVSGWVKGANHSWSYCSREMNVHNKKKNENRGEHLTLGKQRIEEWGEDLNSNRNGENKEWERERCWILHDNFHFLFEILHFYLFIILLWFCAFPTFESNDLMSQMTIQGKNVREIFKTNQKAREREKREREKRERKRGMKKSEKERENEKN